MCRLGWQWSLSAALWIYHKVKKTLVFWRAKLCYLGRLVMHGFAHWSNKLVWLNVKTKPGHVWERKRDRKLDFPWRTEKSHFQVAIKKLKAADSHCAVLIGSRLIKSVNVAQAAEIRHVHITRRARRNWNLCSHGMSNLFKFGCTCVNVQCLSFVWKRRADLCCCSRDERSEMRDWSQIVW